MRNTEVSFNDVGGNVHRREDEERPESVGELTNCKSHHRRSGKIEQRSTENFVAYGTPL